MISLATEMSKPVSRAMPFSSGPRPILMTRRKRSLISMTRFQVMEAGSMSRRNIRRRSSGVSADGSVLAMPSFSRRRSMVGENRRSRFFPAGQKALNSFSSFWADSWRMRTSMAAARRSLAAVTAWMSPVRWRLKSSRGTIWE